MGWTTIYIHARPGAEGEILHNLEHSGFNFMPGYANEEGLILFWVEEGASLRSFKKAIGAKTIFKYRLHFFTSVEAFTQSQYNVTDQDVMREADHGDNSFWTPDLDSRNRLSA